MARSVKAGYIHDILKNSVYMKDSGLYQNLFNALMKLRKDDLSNLSLLIDIAKDDAVRKSAEPTPVMK